MRDYSKLSDYVADSRDDNHWTDADTLLAVLAVLDKLDVHYGQSFRSKFCALLLDYEDDRREPHATRS